MGGSCSLPMNRQNNMLYKRSMFKLTQLVSLNNRKHFHYLTFNEIVAVCAEPENFSRGSEQFVCGGAKAHFF